MITETSPITNPVSDESTIVSNVTTDVNTVLPGETSITVSEQLSTLDKASEETITSDISDEKTEDTTLPTTSETEIALLPPETAVVSTEISTIVETSAPINDEPQNSTFFSEQIILIIVICFMLMVIGILFGTISRQKNHQKKASQASSKRKNAKELDLERLAGEKKKVKLQNPRKR